MPKVYKWFENLEDTPSNPLTRDRIVNWMATTGYVEGFVHKKISPMDKIYIEDYIQEVWLQILSIPPSKLVELYRKGKGKFTNYVKSLVTNNIYSINSVLYKNIRAGRKDEVMLDDTQWKSLFDSQVSSADVTYPVPNRELNTPQSNRITIGVDKIKITTDENFYEDENE